MAVSVALASALMLMAGSSSLEDLTELDRRISAIVEPTGSKARPIDKRIRLARCPQVATIDYASETSLAVRCQPLGWRIRVNLMQLSQPAHISSGRPAPQAIVIRRGESVEFRAKGAGFSVTITAVAMENGRLGDHIRVKSPTSKTPVSARVAGKGLVDASN